MKVTYYGHACFKVETNGFHLLFDPFITPNELAKHISIEDIKANYILLSHGHGDHIADAIKIAENTQATIISSYEIVEWLAKQGAQKTHPMNTGGKFLFDFGSVKCVSAVHSSVLPDGTYGANPMGFVITSKEDSFYYAGDTALTMDMKLIPLTCSPLKLAILPIGDNFTMGYEDAALAAEFVNCNNVLGVHYDTFGWIKIDHKKAESHFEKSGKKLHLLEIGQTRDF